MDEEFGKRLQRARKLKHMTQGRLANEARVSTSYIGAIERGARVPGGGVVAALARALGMSVPDLLGRPPVEDLRRDQLAALVQPIREALDLYDLGADPDVAPRGQDELTADTNRLCALVRASDLRAAAAELPGLIVETTTAAHTYQDRRLWQALAMQYRTAYDVASKTGYVDLATLALDRMGWAAERASDAAVAGLRMYNRAMIYLRSGQARTGTRIAALARATVEQADPGLDRRAVTGQLYLAGAVLSAGAGQRDDAEEYLAAADRIAVGLGETTTLWMSFGPTNASAHRASCYVDQGMYQEALEVARRMEIPATWATSRAAHHHAEVARAYLWSGQPELAFGRLHTARQLAPQQIRHSAKVKEAAAGLVRAHRRPPEALVQFAKWVGAWSP
ncbi:helix-turn-helix domain-containing protein [Kitasatospora phosalacinea]|uniref:Transcriptional regulator n=1 Tax=Kitasatospora phosalacinea TaxID=2065 RepID=A0A9W6PQ05_9ACTN|nr:helix-turn-helix transcriptional regulator [Kitasatospora phosalacinea]GLW58801.1 transcriptional regulator [Kitasatospora phosalacinea]